MGTLDEIQRLSDGQFHLLGDDLLRRLETRYRRLRTHGLNDRGESIKGQPDSYVGDTAATCSCGGLLHGAAIRVVEQGSRRRSGSCCCIPDGDRGSRGHPAQCRPGRPQGQEH